jgi:hypothetical protein
MADPSDRPIVENHVYGRGLAGLERCCFNAATGRMRPFIAENTLMRGCLAAPRRHWQGASRL